MIKKSFFSILLLVLIGLFGCVSTSHVKPHIPEGPFNSVKQEEALDSWNKFLSLSKVNSSNDKPFNMTLKSYFKMDDLRGNLSILLWGNSTSGKSKIRMDIFHKSSLAGKAAGVNNELLAYDATENILFISDYDKLNLYYPLPYSLSEVSSILTGKYVDVFLKKRKDLNMPEEYFKSSKGISFIIKDTLYPGVLTINQDGLPVEWTELDTKGWTLEMYYDAKNNLKKVFLFHTNDLFNDIDIMGLKFLNEKFTDENLKLVIPKDAEIRHITYEHDKYLNF